MEKKRVSGLTVFYILLGLVGIVLTWINNIKYMNMGGNFNSPQLFTDLFTNFVTTSFTLDLFVVAVLFNVFVFVESRRIGIKHWIIVSIVFVLMAIFIALAFSFPMFMALREQKIGKVKRHHLN